MDKDRLRDIHKYGAILSIASIAIAIIGFAVEAPFIITGLFGLLGPLASFYFIGAYLSFTSTYRVVGEELMRGIVWYFGSLVGWSLLTTQTSALSATAFTVVALPTLTALGIILVMVGTRQVTGSDLKIHTESGQLLFTMSGAIVIGFVALYLSLTNRNRLAGFLMHDGVRNLVAGNQWPIAQISREQCCNQL